MPHRRLLFGARLARGLSGGRQSGKPFSPFYGRYGSTGMRLSSGVYSPPSMQYNMVQGGLHNLGTSVAHSTWG